MSDRKQFGFKKEERIIGKKRIEELFGRGSSFVVYPLRVIYLEATAQYEMIAQPKVPLSLLISIPKKRVKSAVKRNRLKRLIREAYRLNRDLFFDCQLWEGRHLEVAFIYLAEELSDYPTVERGVKKALMLLSRKFQNR